MDSKLIDLIYQNKAVEGLAVFDADNQLIENQLNLAVSKVLMVAKTLHNLKSGLCKAGREMRGFLIKSESGALLASIFPDYLVLLEVSEDSSLNEIDSSLRSIFNDASAQLKQTPLPAKRVQPAYQAQRTQRTIPQPILPPQSIQQALNYTQMYSTTRSAAGIDFTNFQNKLCKLLKTVAPLKVITGMIHSAMEDMELDLNILHLPQNVAKELGYKVINKIPNKARRKIIEKEYTALI